MGRIETADLELNSGERLAGMAKPFHKSEMALFSECREQCAKTKYVTTPAL